MQNNRLNAIWNCQNPYQGRFKRVLTVCSAGLLRSPSIAYLLQFHDYNCRAAGTEDYALVEVDEVLIKWADIIIVVDSEKEEYIKEHFADKLEHRVIYNLNIPDNYSYRDPDLMTIIELKLTELGLINGSRKVSGTD